MTSHPDRDAATPSDPARLHADAPFASVSGKLPASRRVPDAADRLDALVHDLNGLLDGSMRWLGLAVATLSEVHAHGRLDENTDGALDKARSQLQTVHASLLRMSELADSSIRTSSLPLGSPFRKEMLRITLGEAVQHAATVQRPVADEHGIDVEVSVAGDAAVLAAGPMYPVLLNGVKNGIDSIIACGGGGVVSVIARLLDAESDATDGQLEIEIVDDGQGPPPVLDARDGAATGPFRHGYTTKAHGAGVGLSIAQSVVEELGGTIALSVRRPGVDRPGAVLRCVVPLDTFRPARRPETGGDA